MVTIVGKIDLESDNKKKLNSFKTKIIEVLEKYHTSTLALGKVLNEMDPSLKNDIKKAFPKYKIPRKKRKNKNDTFDWPLFFEDNMAPKFEVERDVQIKGGDILYYRPEKGDVINNIVESDSISDAGVEESSKTEIIDDIETQKIENTQIHNMKQCEINEHLKKLIEELNVGLYEKERSIRLTLLAILAGESTFMLGEPGTAKSLVARRMSEAFEDPSDDNEIKFFDYLMNQFSQPDELFGPVSIKELKDDKYIRKTDGYLPKAQFAFLDEIWKANPAIQNTLLTILNEKIFRNGDKIEDVPLIGFMSASNELPEKGKGLDAIFDRFLVRILERPIADNDSFRKMISSKRKSTTNISKKLSKSFINTILVESESVEISDECYNIIDFIRKAITKRNSEIQDENEKFQVSDRRWKKIANLMRVSAYCNNRKDTDIMDASLIADCIWSTERQEEDAKKIVADAIKVFGVECKFDLRLLKDKVSEFEGSVDETFFKEEITEKTEKTKSIDGIDYYEVKQLGLNDPESCYISCNEFNYPTNQFHTFRYFNSKTNKVYAEFDEVNKTFSLKDGRWFKIQMKGGCAELVKRTDINSTMMNATVKDFETNAERLKVHIENAINQVDGDIKEQKSQYENNLFSDFINYSKIVFQEQIKAKSELNKLLDKLEKQRKRYL